MIIRFKQRITDGQTIENTPPNWSKLSRSLTQFCTTGLQKQIIQSTCGPRPSAAAVVAVSAMVGGGQCKLNLCAAELLYYYFQVSFIQ